MSKKTHIFSYLNPLLPTEVEGFELLAELALDMRWSWNHATDSIWRQLDSELWNLTKNPWALLQIVSWKKLKRMLCNPSFRKQVDDLIQKKNQMEKMQAWFGQNYSQDSLTCIAYFSMEFMLSEALPIYSGGLGNVAGDLLKSASDLGVPIVGVGLLYQQGYFRQVIDKKGAQRALFPYNDPGQLPITPVRKPNGEWLRLKVPFPGVELRLRSWQAQVGRVKLYLLDSNDPENFPIHRGITSELYGGNSELRLKQEIILGIGGWMLLRALGIQPEVCHLNEGHAALAVLERARSFMEDADQSFDVALTVTRAGNLFTTHTPVAAGFDYFAPSMVEQYLGWYARNQLKISMNDLLALGRKNPNDASEYFNMTYLGIRGSGAVNGVSRLHGEVSREIFQVLFPRWPQVEVPISSVTNGVHMSTWDSAEADELWTNACGKNRWRGATETLERDIRFIPDVKFWQFRTLARQSLVKYARERVARHLAESGASTEMIHQAKHLFDPNILTLGFARRFVPYKRPNLLLQDPQRLLNLLNNPQHPVQLIIAGKSPPYDSAGQELIQEWTDFIKRPEAQSHVVFLSDYDMHLTEHLVQGVDVWINTPRRPWEACGTSGMKVLVNGGLNLSELDGWWAEAYTPEVGWALGDGQSHGDDPSWDAIEAEALYTLLEQKVIPEFYQRNKQGIPTAWVARIRESMARLTPQFSMNRTVREYMEKHYLKAAAAYRERAANKGAIGKNVVDWQHILKKKWGSLRFGDVKIETRGKHYIFEIIVFLNDLDPSTIHVELYANGIEKEPPVRQKMRLIRRLSDTSDGYIYSAKVSATRPANDYTVRLIPYYKGVAIPLEVNSILWQK
ncbi:MAG: alpha-glucan family phosphorylase [Gammaproteobacteria bacterium]|nr:alpha-glucan family phosphorylase [Gammaproteobacteria bacterium]